MTSFIRQVPLETEEAAPVFIPAMAFPKQIVEGLGAGTRKG